MCYVTRKTPKFPFDRQFQWRIADPDLELREGGRGGLSLDLPAFLPSAILFLFFFFFFFFFFFYPKLGGLELSGSLPATGFVKKYCSPLIFEETSLLCAGQLDEGRKAMLSRFLLMSKAGLDNVDHATQISL